jgi:hypothetical protein
MFSHLLFGTTPVRADSGGTVLLGKKCTIAEQQGAGEVCETCMVEATGLQEPSAKCRQKFSARSYQAQNFEHRCYSENEAYRKEIWCGQKSQVQYPPLTIAQCQAQGGVVLTHPGGSIEISCRNDQPRQIGVISDPAAYIIEGAICCAK